MAQADVVQGDMAFGMPSASDSAAYGEPVMGAPVNGTAVSGGLGGGMPATFQQQASYQAPPQ